MTESQKPYEITPVILCGGSGTRLWPLSRTGFPKQFLCLTGSESLFQQAAQRLAGLGKTDIQVTAPLIVTGEDHRFLASEQLREIGIELGSALLEPVGRNTAPALTLAALAAVEGGKDPILVVTPADQTVTDQAAFTVATQKAIQEAASGSIVILGVTPDRPETGYGYIQSAQGSSTEKTLAVQRFVEKPDAETAQAYLAEGEYFWNAGMFVLRASVWLKALAEFRSDILEATKAAWSKRSADAQFVRPGKAEFVAIPPESVDYAAMEQCPGSKFPIKMVPLDAGWNDLGAWDAVWNVLPKDGQGNAHMGDVLTYDSCNTLVHATSRLVSLVGVQDLIVVETPDAVLVADKTRSQDVKHIVNQLGQQKREEQTIHRKVHRPWGWYDSIDEGSRFKVKRTPSICDPSILAMRILILSFYFEPDLSAGSFRMSGLVEALQRQIGPEVRIDVMTTQPNRYASYSQAALPEEVRGAVTVKRFALPAHRSGFLDQSRAFAAYAYQVIKATRGSQYDLVFATSSRLFTATLGAFVASRMRAPLYLDIRDIFVDTLQDVLSPLAARLMLPVFRFVEKLTVRRASHVNLVSAGFLEYFRDRYPATCFSVIPNGIDDVFMGVDYTKETVGSKTIVLYAGNIGEGQGLVRIIPDLAKAFRESHEFWVVGDGGQRSQLENAVNDLSNVKIMSPVSRKDLLALYRAGDILFLHLNDYPAFCKVLPSKLFEYAVTGKPIVAGVAGYAALFLRQVPGAVVFQPCHAEEGVAAIRDVKPGFVSRQAFVERYRRAQLMQELAGSLLTVARRE